MERGPEGAQKYREANNTAWKEMKKAKEAWIDQQCNEIQENLDKNNTKKAFQIVTDLTTEKKGRPSSIQSKSG